MESEIKVGSEVLITNRMGSRLATVTGETPTCWKVGTSLFYKKDLSLRASDRWDTTRMELATQQHKDAITLANYKARTERLFSANYKKLNLIQLQQITKILNEVV